MPEAVERARMQRRTLRGGDGDDGGFDWDALCGLGLPLVRLRARRASRTPATLARLLKPAIAEAGLLRETGRAGREVEALRALLLALKLHFPSFFAAHVGAEPHARALLDGEPDGRTIKLQRVAVAALAEYL